MYLLETTTFELRSSLQPTFTQEGYAILSHRWVGPEITFDQLKGKTSGLHAGNASDRTPQVDKIRGAARTARHLGLKWIWIDSCCIDRANAVEQTESINSMFKWYRDAKVCITYLSDVQKQEPQRFDSLEREEPSIWFSRGWTLQELLAPRDIRFYDKDWKFIGTKMTQAQTLERITGIETHYLTGVKHFGTACIATKMSWMAGRTTTRVEDIAYSMLGIFNVYMTMQYGEALLSASRDESLFAWKMLSPTAGMRFIRGAEQDITWEPGEWGLLAASPDWFADSVRVTTERPPDIIRLPRGFTMAQAGIAVQIPLVPSRLLEHLIIIAGVGLTLPIVLRMYRSRCRKDFEYPLKCSLQNEAGGQTPVRIYLRPVSTGYKRIRSWEFGRGDTSKHLRTLKRTEEGIVFQPKNGYLD
ncbi:HET-domain-containing protein [Xylaria arbuscula]|nr:HET-domain-containing protein [Xylaria arbuscula]